MLALLAVVLIGTAVAHKPRIPSTISIHTKYDTEPTTAPYVYFGHVGSDKRACRRHRTVKLFNDQSTEPIDSDRTNRKGHWEIREQGDLLNGEYYARVKRKVKERFVCKGARSRSVPAPSPPGP